MGCGREACLLLLLYRNNAMLLGVAAKRLYVVQLFAQQPEHFYTSGL